MTLQAQVTSLELSKKLAELGIKQESIWYWGRWGKIWELVQTHPNANLDKYSAFSVAELGELLPMVIDYKDDCFPRDDDARRYWLDIQKHSSEWQVDYLWRDPDAHPYLKVLAELAARAPTEADARAKMLISLIENKLISV